MDKRKYSLAKIKNIFNKINISVIVFVMQSFGWLTFEKSNKSFKSYSILYLNQLVRINNVLFISVNDLQETKKNILNNNWTNQKKKK